MFIFTYLARHSKQSDCIDQDVCLQEETMQC